MKFTHLHVHSHYSLLDGLPKIPELVDYVKKMGMDSVALTDHGVLYGAVEFYKEATKKGIKPIIGCEMYLAFERMNQFRPHIDNKRYHLILLVKNKIGYKNLVKLVTKAHLEGFYYKPRIDEQLLEKYSEGLIGLSACVQGKISQLIISKKFKQAEQAALKYQSIFGPGNFYLELQYHPGIKNQEIANKGLKAIAKKYNIPLVATNDSHYLRREDAKAQDILMLINTGADLNDKTRLTMLADDFSLRSQEEMISEFKDTPEAIENTQKIKEMCNFSFELGNIILPSFTPPKGYTSTQYLKHLCQEGIKKRFGLSPSPDIKERVEKELSVIGEMGFCTYFLIVRDFVKWAKEKQIVVGPGRGSVAGCLVSYLLGITEIDPLKYNLLFERFLNKGRISMPDIDLDFADTRREEVVRYVEKKYGQDKVAQIITFGTMAARASIRDVGRSLHYSYSYCDKIAKTIPIGYSLSKTLAQVYDFKKIYEQEEKARVLIDYAKKLEGVARHVSTHACGVVISKEPLDNIVPLQRSSQNKDVIITQYDMRCVEDLGLLKMDFLGLRNLTIIEKALELIKKNYKVDIDINSLKLDDEKTFKLLRKGQTNCVFQLESEGIKKWLRILRPTEFEDIVAIVALYRPGPMSLIPQYIRRKHKKESIEYIHPKLKPILESTYGILVFQEQLMQIARELAGFSLEQADVLRKAVGKKIKSLLIEQKGKMIEGMIGNGIDKKVAKKIWEWVLPFARYGFNRSHSVCYAMIAYQTAYLKAHYPVEFMAAVFCSEKTDVERIAFLIEECKSMSIEVLPPNINESEENFTVTDKNKIRFGLEAIKNVGHNVVSAIVQERKQNGRFTSIIDFVGRIGCKDLNKKSLESLIKAGVFGDLGERKEFLVNLEKLLEWSREKQKQKTNGQHGLFGKLKTDSNITLEKTQPATKKERLTWEKELLGLYISGHPLEDFAQILKEKTSSVADITKNFLGIKKRVLVGGVISKVKKVMTKNGKPMLFVMLEDQTDRIEVVVFPRIAERNFDILKQGKIVLVKGSINMRNDKPKIICEQVEEIIDNGSHS